MDKQTWTAVADRRRALADLLDGLDDTGWEARSLCERWRVRDVAAHLAMTPSGEPRPTTMLRALLRDRGRLWAAGAEVAVAYSARRSQGEIVRELREGAASRTRPVFVVADNILLDLLVHGQDIAVPLGLTHPVPRDQGDVALRRVWEMGWPFHARRRLAGVTLRSEDGRWREGTGPEVHGAAGDLLLLLTGRTDAALDRLAGPGVDVLRPSALPQRRRNSSAG